MSRSLISLLFLIAAVALFWAWSRPNLVEIDKLKAEKMAIEKALADSRELQKLRDTLLEQYNLISGDDLARLEKLLPRDEDMAKLMVELENISKQTGAVIKSFNVQKSGTGRSVGRDRTSEADASLYQEAALNITISAAYEGFRAFLAQLESSLRIVDAEQISFSASESNYYEFNIKAKTYWR